MNLAMGTYAKYKIPVINEWLCKKAKEVEEQTQNSSDIHITDVLLDLYSLKSQDIWPMIKNEYGITKRAFGVKINFINDPFRRKIIFRDVEQAYILAKIGFSKPSVILAGSIIEELLRQYLEHKKINASGNTFEKYIVTCKENNLLQSAIHSLTDSVRHFRNYVHQIKEKSKKDTISKATAKGAVSSIFTVANDF